VKLAIELDAERVAAGEEVRGRVLVQEGGSSRSLTLTVSFRERSPAYVETRFSDGGVIHEGNLATGQAVEFRFTMPNEALPNARGRHGELFWELEAVSDEPGLDTRATRVLEVTAARAGR
jgi:hypothetical protein